MGNPLSSLFIHLNENENDRVLQEREQNFLNQIYKNNGFDPLMTTEQYYRNKTKHTKFYNFPISIKEKEINLEKDILSITDYFLKFIYSSKYDFDLLIFLNAIEDFSHKYSDNDYYPSEYFLNKIIDIKNIQKGNNIEFLDKNCSINLEEFNENKMYDKNYYDLVIECFVKNKYKLVYCCKILLFNENRNEIKIQEKKIWIKNNWFNCNIIFGLDDNQENKLCEACLTNVKNTIFLPCTHSYTCEQCAVNVRIMGNKCPLCRNIIKDIILIDNKNGSCENDKNNENIIINNLDENIYKEKNKDKKEYENIDEKKK